MDVGPKRDLVGMKIQQFIALFTQFALAVLVHVVLNKFYAVKYILMDKIKI